MVLCSIAQSIAFTYKSYLDSPSSFNIIVNENPHSVNKNRKQPGFCEKLFSLFLATTDVIDDTRNTFIKSYDEDIDYKET